MFCCNYLDELCLKKRIQLRMFSNNKYATFLSFLLMLIYL